LFKSVRINIDKPTPYLKENVELLKGSIVFDLGCGNGRNSKYLKSLGYEVFSFDKSPDYGKEIDLSEDNLPRKPTPNIILCNYVLCFLDNKGRKHLCNEINSISKSGTILMVELYPAKTGVVYSTEEIKKMFPNSVWNTRHMVKNRFILERV
jgi:SAM-dependent methyltransferase